MRYLFLFLITASLQAKLLVLIVASDDKPVYRKLQETWRSYMHFDAKNVEAYFVRGDEKLKTTYVIDGDTLWVKTSEGLVPGVLNKTILSMEALLPKLKEFDYVLRTNLSSFYIFPRLLRKLESAQKNGFYCAVPFDNRCDVPIGSGSGFLLSTDLVEWIVSHKHQLLNQQLPDDMVFGMFLNHYGFPLIPSSMLAISSLGDWEKLQGRIPEDVFQIRVKNQWDDARLEEDPFIISELVEKFY